MKYKVELYENGKWGELEGVVIPFNYTTVLDDTLDSGVIYLKGVTRKKPIKRFSKIAISIYKSLDDESLSKTIGK